MPIPVTCPSCLSRFQVSDKFAGKKGPCPKCKKEIQVPSLAEQVVVHAPETGPKDAKGRPVLNPIKRIETEFSWPIAIGVAALALLILGGAIAVRFSMESAPTPLLVLGSLLLAPPLGYAGYLFLRNSELEGFTGQELLIRSAACGAVYALTWGIYALIPMYLLELDSMAKISLVTVSVMVPIMILIGTLAALGAFELEIGQSVLHYGLYFTITTGLAVIMGVPLAEPLAKETVENKAKPVAKPTGESPIKTAPAIKTGPAETAAPETPPEAPPAAPSKP